MLVGLVGKPNSGKSTLGKALSLADLKMGNFPFTTLEPNHAVAHVRVKCPERGERCSPNHGYCRDSFRFIPVEILDVAGLVPDAHLGKGCGNKFLDDLRQADVLIHVVDISGSTNEQGENVARGSHDPLKDIEFLEKEIGYWFLGLLKKNWEKFSRDVQMQRKDLIKALVSQFTGLKVTERQIKETISELGLSKEEPAKWGEEGLQSFAFALREKSKKIIIAANKIDVPGGGENLLRLREQFPQYISIPCSSESELALREADKAGLIDYVPGSGSFTVKDESRLSDKQKQALHFIRKNVLEVHGSTGVQECLDRAVFEVLGMIAVYPVANITKLSDKKGKILPDAFIVREGTKLKEFAGMVHTAMADKFIGGLESETRKKIGADYELKDGDIIEIIFGK